MKGAFGSLLDVEKYTEAMIVQSLEAMMAQLVVYSDAASMSSSFR